MGKANSLNQSQREFILSQNMFFVATAASDGRVNLSPKGMDLLRVVDDNHIVWLNLTGSGNESAAHVLENERMTIMFCSFDRQPLILRLYGKAAVIYPRHADQFNEYDQLFGEQPGTRQFFEVNIDLVQTSCGYSIPHYDYSGERQTLTKWARNKGKEGVASYWAEHNQVSLDGKPTNITGHD